MSCSYSGNSRLHYIASGKWRSIISKDQIVSSLTKAFPEKAKAILEMLDVFEKSIATVYCEDCNIIFYSGMAGAIANENRFVDWKMLAFRHVWDTKHHVICQMPFFQMATMSLFGLVKYIDPQDNTKFRYYESVEEFRERQFSRGSVRAYRSFDENWSSHDSCICSVCGEKHHNPKNACYCCFGSKGWMPYHEVDKINVNGGE